MDASEEQKRAALETIIRESEKLLDLAKANKQDFLAFLLENVLDEARAARGRPAGEDPPQRS